jgi:biotin transporter BioY
VTLKVNSRFTLLAEGLLGQMPIYLSLTNLLVMFIPIQDGTAFKEQRYSKTYYYLSVIALIASLLNYLVGNDWIKTIIKFAVSDSNAGEQSGTTLYKDI